MKPLLSYLFDFANELEWISSHLIEICYVVFIENIGVLKKSSEENCDAMIEKNRVINYVLVNGGSTI